MAMHTKFKNPLVQFITLLCVYSLTNIVTNSEPTQGKQALLTFLSKVPHANRVNWNSSDSACNWFGVECDSTRSYVYALRLPGAGLTGPIPPNTIGKLDKLRVISFHHNALSGQVPLDFGNLTVLRSLYLQDNQLTGEFPESLTRLSRLHRLDLSSNNLSGKIPFGVSSLTQLTGLLLQNNDFSGNLPSISSISTLVDFNVSNNKLNGSIPKSLSKFPVSSFAGNSDLCGRPLPRCSPFFPSPAPAPAEIGSLNPEVKKSKKNKLSTGAIVGIVIGCVLVALLLLFLIVFCVKKAKRGQPESHPKPVAALRASAEAEASSSKDGATGGLAGAEGNKLVFFDGGVDSFDLEDLLRASAEVLGKGSAGTSYKAAIEEGRVVVVKRLKEVAVSKREFEMQMDVVGKIKHENVVPLRAYYYSNEEKLLVSDYMPAGSLSALLHGSRGSGQTPLDWDNRIQIALSSARGLTHLHLSGKVPHGNIKSSNILLKPDHDASVSDFGLNPLFDNTLPSHRIAGYRAPEVIETRKVTFKSDVYSFGVLLMELLTGKAPNQASLGDEGIDLPMWVQSVVREEWTAEVFDLELMRYNDIEEDMVQLLQIAMACVATVPDQRPEINDVLRMIEDINRDDGLSRQSFDDPSEGSHGQTPMVETTRKPPTSVTP